MARSWYVFTGGDDPLNILNYYKIEVKHRCLCGTQICAIYATDSETDSHPADPLSPNMKKYIKEALVTHELQPSMPWSAKKYVYLKH
jgi:hypothetical protein